MNHHAHSDRSARRLFTATATRDTQYFTVPHDVRMVSAWVWGAGGTSSIAPGGGGGFTRGDIPVRPGETLAVVVGSASGSGGGGGGLTPGGGLSGVYRLESEEPRALLVAGGGGGGNHGGHGSWGAGGPGGGNRGGAGGGGLSGGGGADGATGGLPGADMPVLPPAGAGGDFAHPGEGSGGFQGGVLPLEITRLSGGGGAGATGFLPGSGGGAGYAGGGGGGAYHDRGHERGGGGGGSGFYAQEPHVSRGETHTGTGRFAAGREHEEYEEGIGNADGPGLVVLRWTAP
ncbi:hypothetical protein [Streptomyces lavendulae]|uniref:hypothetical protein n=1 Tax=Streptomyces lavendulae TaxID=1914 RepID=UPI0031F15C01